MKLQDICTVFTDGDWIESKDQSNEGIRLVQTGNIGEGKYLEKESRAKYISEETFERLKCTEIFPGDILVSRLPEPVGRACIIPDRDERMITAVDCTICRVNQKLAFKEYLCYFMQSDVYYARLLGDVTGTTRKRISRKNLGNIELNIPDIEVQKTVVNRLKLVEHLIESRMKELQLLEELVKARFVELTNKEKTVPTRMGDVATYVNGYAFKPTDWKNKGLPIIRIQNLNDSNALYNYFDGEINEKYRIHKGDVLVSWATHLEAYIYGRGRMHGLISISLRWNLIKWR